MKRLSFKQRQAMFAKLHSIGFSVTKKQRMQISKKLYDDNILKFKAKAKPNEIPTVSTNRHYETFVYAHTKNDKGKIDMNSNIRTLGFVGHRNNDNPVDVRVIPAR